MIKTITQQENPLIGAARCCFCGKKLAPSEWNNPEPLCQKKNSACCADCVSRYVNPVRRVLWHSFLSKKERNMLLSSIQKMSLDVIETVLNRIDPLDALETYIAGSRRFHPCPKRRRTKAEKKAAPQTDAPAEGEFTFSDDNPFKYIHSQDDVIAFVRAIADVSASAGTAHPIPYNVLRFLWVVAAYLLHSCRKEDLSVASMQKILKLACTPAPQRDFPTTFDIMVGDCQDETIKKNYEYFKVRTFGTYSNCYKKILALAMNVLESMPLDLILKKLQDIQSNESAPDTTDKPLFGELIQNKGQDLQYELYRKRLTTVHEAGHAVAYYLLGVDFLGADCIPYDTGDGHVLNEASDTIEPYKDAIISFAGLVAEEVVYGPAAFDAWLSSSDSKHATELIKNEVITDLSNPVDAQKYVFIDADALGLQDKESPYIVYETIKRCLDLRQTALQMMEDHKPMVEALAEELLEKKSLAAEEIKEFLDRYTQNQRRHSRQQNQT